MLEIERSNENFCGIQIWYLQSKLQLNFGEEDKGNKFVSTTYIENDEKK